MSDSINRQRYRAVITGASSGIGRAIARSISQEADWLVLNGRNAEALDAMRLACAPARTDIVVGDLTEEGTLAEIRERAGMLGGINLLVNSAGSGGFHAFETQDVGEIRALLDTNLLAPMLLSRELVPLLRQAPASQIVNVGSLFGYIGYPGFAAYGASKAGLRGFTQALRRELADTTVDVRHFVPRATRTAINDDRVNAMNKDLHTHEDTPEQVAGEFLRFLKGARHEGKVGIKEAFFVLVNHLLPVMPDRAIRAQLPVIRRHMPK